MNDVFIYHISRVPSGKKGGVYKSIPPEVLGAFLLDKLIETKSCELETNGEVILANSIGTMGNPARNCVLRSNLNPSIVATSLDFQCGGAYKAVQIGIAQIASNQAEWIIAGGIESNSLQAERNYHINDPRRTNDQSLLTADFSPYPSHTLAQAAEELAVKYDLSKEEMINWTLESHQRAVNCFKNGIFENWVIPFDPKVKQDESIRSHISKELLLKAQSTYLIDRTNTADFHDGAGIILLGNKGFGEKNALKPLAKICQTSFIGLHPNHSPAGAIEAAKPLMDGSLNLYEICESYAVKPLAFAKEFSILESKLNIFGSNLAMGHPFAASGVINILNLYLALRSRGYSRGLVAAGIAGGLGASMVLEIEK